MPDADYFSAADDAAAIAVIEAGSPELAGLDVIYLKNIDPVVAIAQLEAILTGCSYDEARQRPRSGQLLSSPEVESPFVLSVSDGLVEALTSRSQDDLLRAAEAWSMAEELRMFGVDAGTAAIVVETLAGLAERARAEDLRLYCFWSL
jgi:hypothetical protein